MASKWAWLKGKYPELTDEATYDDVLLAAMVPHRSKSIEELAVAINTVESRKTDIEQSLSAFNAELVALERLLIDQFDKTGVEKISVGGYGFSPKPEPAPKVVDPSALRAYVDENMPEILSVNYQTLRGLVARALEGGEDIPPGVEVNVRTSISRRKS
jgi:hypothetical protein